MSTRVGLYGGSFDPPHVCHVLVATWALCRGELDALWVIPTFEHPFGKKMAPFQSRCDMIAAALDHLGPTVRVDPVEEGLGGTSYTIRTVEALQRTYPEHRFSWICGADAWATRESTTFAYNTCTGRGQRERVPYLCVPHARGADDVRHLSKALCVNTRCENND